MRRQVSFILALLMSVVSCPRPAKWNGCGDRFQAGAEAVVAAAALSPYQVPAVPKPANWPRSRLVGFMRELADFV